MCPTFLDGAMTSRFFCEGAGGPQEEKEEEDEDEEGEEVEEEQQEKRGEEEGDRICGLDEDNTDELEPHHNLKIRS